MFNFSKTKTQFCALYWHDPRLYVVSLYYPKAEFSSLELTFLLVENNGCFITITVTNHPMLAGWGTRPRWHQGHLTPKCPSARHCGVRVREHSGQEVQSGGAWRKVKSAVVWRKEVKCAEENVIQAVLMLKTWDSIRLGRSLCRSLLVACVHEYLMNMFETILY